MKSLSDLWDSILARLSGELSDMTIKTWFDEITVVTMEDSALVLHCSNPFKKNTVEARHPHLPFGNIMFAAALAVILLNGAVFQDVDSIIYGIMFNFIVSAVINKMMFGFSSSMLAMIVTDDGKAACAEIDRVADRGSTILQGHGGYGGQPKDVVLCACSNKQLYEIEHAVQAIDPGCFIIMLQSNEVHGEGFRQLELGKSESSESK